jgi:mono/diheme cytochrome c family protein
MNPLVRIVVAAALAACALASQAQSAVSTSRGELLYSNHCIECHTSKMHWRERSQARDWPSLRAQVTRWQAQAGLQWSDEDVDEVARYLDKTYYHFKPAPG